MLLEERSKIPIALDHNWCINTMYQVSYVEFGHFELHRYTQHGWVESEDKILEGIVYYEIDQVGVTIEVPTEIFVRTC